VSLADCITIETARFVGARLATSDPHLLDVCHAESVDAHPLLAPDGTMWRPST
jgi:predicted nucleic acid-binding protein